MFDEDEEEEDGLDDGPDTLNDDSGDWVSPVSTEAGTAASGSVQEHGGFVSPVQQTTSGNTLRNEPNEIAPRGVFVNNRGGVSSGGPSANRSGGGGTDAKGGGGAPAAGGLGTVDGMNLGRRGDEAARAIARGLDASGVAKHPETGAAQPATTPGGVTMGPSGSVLPNKTVAAVARTGAVDPSRTRDPAAVTAAQQALAQFRDQARREYGSDPYARGDQSEEQNILEYMNRVGGDWYDQVRALANGQLDGGFRGMSWEPGVGWSHGNFGRMNQPGPEKAATSVNTQQKPAQSSNTPQNPAGVYANNRGGLTAPGATAARPGNGVEAKTGPIGVKGERAAASTATAAPAGGEFVAPSRYSAPMAGAAPSPAAVAELPGEGGEFVAPAPINRGSLYNAEGQYFPSNANNDTRLQEQFIGPLQPSASPPARDDYYNEPQQAEGWYDAFGRWHSGDEVSSEFLRPSRGR